MFVKFSETYLHQDWDLDFESPEEALLVFRANHPDAAASVAEAATTLLRECATEAQRYEVLAGIGWNFAGPAGRLDEFLSWTAVALLDQPAEKTAG